LYGGYAFLRDQEIETNFPVGWSMSFAKNLNRSLGIVGDVGGNYRSEEGVDVSIHAFLGGMRYSFRGKTVTPYVEGLAGLARASVGFAGVSVSNSEFAVQGGIGISTHVTESVAVRTGVDFRNIFGEGGSTQEFRVLGGVSFGFGGFLEGPPRPAPSQIPERRAPEPQPTRQPPPAPQPQPPTEEPPLPEPEPVQPPEVAPPTRVAPREPAQLPLDRGQEMMRGGDYPAAADYFREHLRRFASSKYTIAVGLFCKLDNVAQIVGSVTGFEQLFLIRLRLRGRECYGVYWGLYDSQFDAQQEIGSLPAALRAAGQAPMPVERILR
jgi:hypothetical protein